jgi:hypothetical protein
MELCDERLYAAGVNAGDAELILAGVPAEFVSLGVIEPSDLTLPGVSLRILDPAPLFAVELPDDNDDPHSAGGCEWSVGPGVQRWDVVWTGPGPFPSWSWERYYRPEPAARVLASVLAYARHAARAGHPAWAAREGIFPVAAQMLLLTPADLARDDCQVGSDGSVTLLDPDGSPMVAVGPPPANRSDATAAALLYGEEMLIVEYEHSFAHECQHVGLASVAWRTRTPLS